MFCLNLRQQFIVVTHNQAPLQGAFQLCPDEKTGLLSAAITPLFLDEGKEFDLFVVRRL
jgi:hypothetical protein